MNRRTFLRAATGASVAASVAPAVSVTAVPTWDICELLFEHSTPIHVYLASVKQKQLEEFAITEPEVFFGG